MEFPFGEVLALNECLSRVLIRFKTNVLDGILSILTDVDNGSTQQVDVRHVPNLDQILTVGSLRRGGTQIEIGQKIAPLPPKSCREGPGPLTISK